MITLVEKDQGNQAEVVDGIEATGLTFEVWHTKDRRPAKAPDGWIVFNAPRPLSGTLPINQGPGLHWEASPGYTGIHFAAVDPADPMAMDWIRRNHRDRAVIVAYGADYPLTSRGMRDRDPRRYRYSVQILKEYGPTAAASAVEAYWAWAEVDVKADQAEALELAQGLREALKTPGTRVEDIYTGSANNQLWVDVDGSALKGRPIRWQRVAKVIKTAA